MSKEASLERVYRSGIVAIIRKTEAELAIQTCEALMAGGLEVMEVTLNTAGALGMIKELGAHFGDRILIGAGTVLAVGAAEEAVAAGARFIVSPHTDPALIQWCNSKDVPVFPGAFTPTEIITAHRVGADVVKVFPVGTVGPSYIKDLQGPLGDIKLLPTGGVNVENAGAFIKAGAWALGVGGVLVDRKAVAERNFAKLTETARRFRAAIDGARG